MGGSLAPLVAAELRRRARAPGAAVGAVLGLAAVGVAWATPAGDGAAGVAVTAAGAATFLAALAAALSAAASHPDDRATGAGPWLDATGASPAARRAAPAVAAAASAVAVGLGGGVVAAVLGVATGLASPATRFEPLRVDGPPRLTAAADGRPAAAATVAADGPFVLDARPVFRDADAAARGTTRLRVTDADGVRELDVATRGPTRVDARGPTRLEPADPRVDLRVAGARAPRGAVPFPLQALALGLLLGLAAACVAPTAALLSRGTHAATAALSAAVLVAVGLARDGGLETAAGAAASPGGAAAAAVLRGAVALAPDLSALAALDAAAAGRAVRLADLAALAPAALHAAVATALLVLGPRVAGGRR